MVSTVLMFVTPIVICALMLYFEYLASVIIMWDPVIENIEKPVNKIPKCLPPFKDRE